jgi:hypothetical protein
MRKFTTEDDDTMEAMNKEDVYIYIYIYTHTSILGPHAI